jgi:PPM family protein phosphatase
VIVRAAGRTDVGTTREHNEDAFLLVDLMSGNSGSSAVADTAAVTGGHCMLMMVADGLGGAAAGEIASRMATETVRGVMERAVREEGITDPDQLAEALRSAVAEANTVIHGFARDNPEHKGMGTTATVAVLHGETLFVAQIGDSRAYLVRDGVAEQITKDQSLMQRLIEAGELTPEQAERSERRNIILQALGPEPVVRIDVTHQRVRRGDRLVLCTDGLSGLVRREEIAQDVSSGDELHRICERLVERANAGGGPDNITVVTAAFEGSSLPEAQAGDSVGYTVYPLPDEDATPVSPHAAYVSRITGPFDAVTMEQLVPLTRPHAGVGANRALMAAIGFTIIAALVLLGARQLRGEFDAPGGGAPAPAELKQAS